MVVVASGCLLFLHQAPSNVHVGGENVPMITVPAIVPSGAIGPPASQAAAQVTPQATPQNPFDMSKASWVEYKLTGNGQPASTVRLEYGTQSSGGSTTEQVKRTITSDDTSSASSSVPGKMYSLQFSSTKSSTSTSSIVPIEQIKSNDPVLGAGDIDYSQAGQDSISVPKGSFNCLKYDGNFKGADSTYWAAPGVPVPIKIYTAYDGSTYELSDWGT
jgi:hypothetical protein